MAKWQSTGSLVRLKRWLRHLTCGAVILSSVTGGNGCTRPFFRKLADKEVDCVLAEKNILPEARIEQYHVYPDPRARFGDPTDPDRPPMPPDDPAAHYLSPNPQKPGKAGVARIEEKGYMKLLAEWDSQNRAAAAASGQTEKDGQTGKDKADDKAADKSEEKKGGYELASVASTTSLTSKPGADTPRPFRLKLEQAVELGLINSREYQDRRENLYLTALPVTLERFAFSAQFFAAEQAIREWAGRETPDGRKNNWTLNSNAGLAKLFPTGALLLLNFANQTVFNLGGGNGRPLISQSTINLDLIQPLLRGGGRAVTLEPLTQAERNLVYEVRNFARFRKEFYVAIAGGGGGSITGATFQPTGVIAPANFSPTGGLGSSGLVPGIIPPVPVLTNPGLDVNPSASGRIGLTTAFAAPVTGYLSTLLEAAQMQVDEYSIQKLEEYLRLARAMEEGGDISGLQVDQFEQQVLTRRSTLLGDQLSYLQALDTFKLQLGLPTNLPIELDDTPFRPLNQQFRRYEDLFAQFVATSNEPLPFGTLEMVPRVRQEMRRIFTTSAVVKGTRFRTEIETSLGTWEKLAAEELQRRLAELAAERRRLLDRKTDLESKGQSLSAAEQQRVDTLSFEIDVGQFEKLLRDYESQPWKNEANEGVRRRQQQLSFRYVVSAFINVLIKARNERIEKVRSTWPDLAKLRVNDVDLLKADLDEAQAAVVQVALTNRLDLMNVRAQVVDAWRQLAIFANALLGTFNVAYHLDSSTPAGLAQPLAFSAARTHHELFLNTVLPLVRTPERNNYRASLINYERARRILQRAEDAVAFDTRNEIRSLRQLEENYRIQQRQVELGYLTVENSLDTFQAPSAPGTASTAASAFSLTNQLITAQQSLYQAQFTMTTIWINYLNTRLQLYRDMELMPLDFRGVWIDELATPESSEGGDRKQGAGPGQCVGERCVPGSPPRAGLEWLPDPEYLPPAKGTRVVRPR
jgi:outer membrane protein TolC